MDPLALYLLMVAIPLIACVGAAVLARQVTRFCPSCHARVWVGAKACRTCHYVFT